MKIELINTGTELLLGTTVNTHAAWVGQELFKQGLRLQKQETVPDGEAIKIAIGEAIERSDAIFVTGGLGPTSDDITRELLSEVIGAELIEDEHAMRTIEEYFASRNYPMAEANRKQALVPVGAEVIPNPNGTAPGVYVPPRLGKGCAIFLLPGPPRELYPMFQAEVSPRLKALSGGEVDYFIKELKFTGIGESDFHDGVDEQLSQIDGLEFGYCARPGEVDCRLIGTEAQVEFAEKVVKAQFAEFCFSDEGKEYPEEIISLLEEEGQTVTFAESCTGGSVAARMTDVSGASAVFDQSYVTYSNQAKFEMLGVMPELIEEFGAVSAEVARAMAEGARMRANDDFAIAITGVAGPTGGTEEKPVGTVFLALAQVDAPTYVVRRRHRRSRESFKFVVSQEAFDMVRRRVLELPDLKDKY